jgi:hypothetical protein
MTGMAPDDVVIEVDVDQDGTRAYKHRGMTALLPRDVVVDIVCCVRRLGGMHDHLTPIEQFFVSEELRSAADHIDRGAPPAIVRAVVLINPHGFRGRPLYRLVRLVAQSSDFAQVLTPPALSSGRRRCHKIPE